LALRAGNEKDEDQADTVGCCSLRVEHIQLFDEKDGQENVVVFDFLGKDSIRYYNEVPVEKRVFKNLKLFKEKKNNGDDLFDRLNVSPLFRLSQLYNMWGSNNVVGCIGFSDVNSKQAFNRTNGRIDSQSVSYVQCFTYAATAIG